MDTKKAQLDWQAFQYVADELEARERERFEARLADDTEACEAVVAAMRLAQTIDGAFGGDASREGTTISRRPTVHVADSLKADSQLPSAAPPFSTYSGLAIAAGLAALLATAWWLLPQADVAPTPSVSGNVALAWATEIESTSVELSTEDTDWPLEAMGDALEDVEYTEYTEELALGDDSIIDEDDDWLLVALANTSVPQAEVFE